MTLLVAAVYELTPLKDVCLGKCRSPLGFLLGAWRDGRAGALQMGAKHGGWCVGCCWALMASLFALGRHEHRLDGVRRGADRRREDAPVAPRRHLRDGGRSCSMLGVLLLVAPDADPGPHDPGLRPNAGHAGDGVSRRDVTATLRDHNPEPTGSLRSDPALSIRLSSSRFLWGALRISPRFAPWRRLRVDAPLECCVSTGFAQPLATGLHAIALHMESAGPAERQPLARCGPSRRRGQPVTLLSAPQLAAYLLAIRRSR